MSWFFSGFVSPDLHGFLHSYRSDISHAGIRKKHDKVTSWKLTTHDRAGGTLLDRNNKKTWIFQKEGHLNTNDEDFWLVVEPTHLKRYWWNWIMSPGRGENKKYSKPPPRNDEEFIVMVVWLFGKY